LPLARFVSAFNLSAWLGSPTGIMLKVKITLAFVVMGVVLCGCQTPEEQVEWQNQKKIRDAEQVQHQLNDQAAQFNSDNDRGGQ
jgi:outer membrane murein-binding lipoprotein Lpp